MTEPAPLPFAAPCRRLAPAAPWDWLRRGFADQRRAPLQSLAWGSLTALLSLGISTIAWQFGSYWLLLAMLSGFVFVAPLIAIAPYSISTQLARGERPSLRSCLQDQLRLRGTAMVCFAVTAFSLPMMHERRVDAITAVVTSVNAVLRNKRAMLLWVTMIVASVLIGHASWHAYRDTIDAAAWPLHEDLPAATGVQT